MSPREVEVDRRRAWVAGGGISLANGIAFGTTYTFGTFFAAMAEEFDADRGANASILAITLLLFFGAVIWTVIATVRWQRWSLIT